MGLESALRYRLVSRWTNWLVVAPRAEDEKAHDLPVLRKVPQTLAAAVTGLSDEFVAAAILARLLGGPLHDSLPGNAQLALVLLDERVRDATGALRVIRRQGEALAGLTRQPALREVLRPHAGNDALEPFTRIGELLDDLEEVMRKSEERLLHPRTGHAHREAGLIASQAAQND